MWLKFGYKNTTQAQDSVMHHNFLNKQQT